LGLSYSERDSHWKNRAPIFLQLIGMTLLMKGELELSRKSSQKSLKLNKGNSVTEKESKALVLRDIGGIYYLQKQPKMAIEYIKKSIEIFEKLNNPAFTSAEFHMAIRISIDQNSLEKAKYYFKRFKAYYEQRKFKIPPLYYLSGAIILISGGSLSERAEAEDILKKIIHESPRDPAMRKVIPVLCEFYINEFE